MTELLPSHSVVTVLSWGVGEPRARASRCPTTVGLGCGHKLAGWSKAGILSHFCSVGSPEMELKYSCYCPFETRDPAAPKGEHDLWKPCHRQQATAQGP